MHADRQPTGACIEIIAAERTLPPRIEFPLRVERERMRRYSDAAAQRRQHVRRPIRPTQRHEQITPRDQGSRRLAFAGGGRAGSLRRVFGPAGAIDRPNAATLSSAQIRDYHEALPPVEHAPARIAALLPPGGDSMKTLVKLGLAVLAASIAGIFPAAAQKLTFTLNWVAGGDHAPYFYAQKLGWYKEAGIDVDFETGRGSAASAQKVGAGSSQLGLSDMAGVLLFRGKGADLVGLMNVYANSPQGLYWLKSSGIKSLKDFAGKKIGNPAGDGARTMWPALAKANGVDPNSVTWVNIDANAKLGALKAKTIDATTSFFNLHHVFARELGDDMGFLAWKDAGVNMYGNSIIANEPWLKANREKAEKFVKVTQRAFGECVKTPDPCIKALVEANGALLYDNELLNWHLVTILMNDETSRTIALGWHDDKRMETDYKLVDEYLKMEKPYDVKTAYTNEFLDKNLKMPPINPPKLY
jgi:NitT/TauT family transport system substrate-binding protein